MPTAPHPTRLADQRAAVAGFLPQLDGLRCFAVLLVILQHGAKNPLTESLGIQGVGVYGVWLFFVLSGFLISRVLLQARDSVETGASSVKRAFAVFYARRSLRIFPPYYLLLAVMLFSGIAPHLWREAHWHLLYMSNWLFVWQANWTPMIGHFWSLSVEEQFYLLWPAIIILTPRHLLPRAILVSLLIGPLSRAIGAIAGSWSIHVLVPTTSSLDCLSLGALLAWHMDAHPEAREIRERWLKGALLVGVAGLMLTLFYSFVFNRGYTVIAVTEALSAGLVSTWLVARAAVGFKGIAGLVLTNAVVRSFGRVSYGMYLYHGMVMWLVWELLTRSAPAGVVRFFDNTIPHFALASLSTYLVALVSFVAFERPLMRLKPALVRIP